MTAASPNYRSLLLDFRADIFRRLTTVIAVFCLASAYALLFMNPLPHRLVFFMYLFCGFTLYLRHIAQHSLDFARYVFVVALYIAIVLSMLLLPVSWLPFLIFPIVFIGEMIVSYVNVVLVALYFGCVLFLTGVGYADYPLQPLGLFLCLM